MLTHEQFKTLQQKRESTTGAEFWLYDALICLDLDMPETALKSLKTALKQTSTELESK